MMRTTLSLLILLTLTVAAAHAGHVGNDLWLPSVGRGPGAGDTEWYTTLWIHNPGSEAVTTTIRYYPRGYTTSEPLEASELVAPGATLRIANAVEALFGLSDSFGALQFVADSELLISSRIYAEPDGGEAESVGQFFAAVPSEFGLDPGESTEALGVWQTDPAPESVYRYNFGFVEIANDPVEVVVDAVDGTGTVIATRTYDLGPYGALQRNVSDLAPGFSHTNVTLRFEVVSTTGRIIAFGSGLANRSNDPSTFEMGFPDRTSSGGGGLTEVVSDASLAGTGTSDDPLGVAPGGIVAGHIATPISLSADGSTATLTLSNDGAGPALEIGSASGPGAVVTAGVDDEDLILGGGVGGITSDTAQSDSSITVSSNADVVLRLDRDASGGSGESSMVRVRNSADEQVFSVDDGGNIASNGGIVTHGEIAMVVDGGSLGELELAPILSADRWVEAFGSARATNGWATIGLPASFRAVAATDEPYFVFMTPIGDRPLLVSLYSTEENRFIIRAFSLDGGSGSGNFQYRVVARRINSD